MTGSRGVGRLFITWVNAIDGTPGCIGVIVRLKESAIPGDMEPTVIVKLELFQFFITKSVDALHKGTKIARQHGLEFLHPFIRPGKEVKLTFKQPLGLVLR